MDVVNLWLRARIWFGICDKWLFKHDHSRGLHKDCKLLFVPSYLPHYTSSTIDQNIIEI